MRNQNIPARLGWLPRTWGKRLSARPTHAQPPKRKARNRNLITRQHQPRSWPNWFANRVAYHRRADGKSFILHYPEYSIRTAHPAHRLFTYRPDENHPALRWPNSPLARSQKELYS